MGDNVKLHKCQVVERKLGKEQAFGQYYDDIVEIDPRQTSKEYLNTLIHEMLHHHFPDLCETKVRVIADRMAHQIWLKNYRRIKK